MPKIKSTLLDNSDNFKMITAIKQLLSDQEVNELWIATGYWDIPGTALVADELLSFLQKENTKVRLLIGKDPMVFKTQLKSIDMSKIDQTKDLIKIELEKLTPKPELEKAVSILKTYCKGDDPKIEIRVFNNPDDQRQFFHSKCYIFLENKNSGLYAIMGSSNFTKNGLEGNSELNFLEVDDYVINAKPDPHNLQKGYLEWFNEKWTDTQLWNKEFLLALSQSPIGKAVSGQSEILSQNINILNPREIYYKLLIEMYNDSVDNKSEIKESDYLPADPSFKRLGYQLQAVNQAFTIMKKHRGVILADVVGLGKTYVALMIIKRHLIQNNFSRPVLVITPPAIKKSWEDAIEYFDSKADKKIAEKIRLSTIGELDIYDFEVTETEFSDLDDNFTDDNYGLIVIDESHRFRNSATMMYKRIEDLILKTNPDVVLLSATPQNNRPKDIANQIYLFEQNRQHSTLTGLGRHGSNLEAYFAEKEKLYEECISDRIIKDGKKIQKTSLQQKEDMEKLKDISNQIRDEVLNHLVIRRTRTDLQSDLYREDIKKQGIVFPQIQKPEGLPYEMTGDLAILFVETLNIIAPQIAYNNVNEKGELEFDFRVVGKDYLGYYRYRAIQYLKTEYKKRYEYNSKKKFHAAGTMTAEGISDRLAGLMELHLVKRLESSRDAFEETLQHLLTNTNNMITMFEKDSVFICPDFDVHAIINAYPRTQLDRAFSDIRKKIDEYNKKNRTDRNAVYKSTDFNKDSEGNTYLENLRRDAELVSNLAERWAKNKQDKKRDTFIKNIESKFLNKKKNPNQKMIVFTECIATQNMLYDYLDGEYPGQVLKVTSANRKEVQKDLEANFDANCKNKKNQYKILVATDILAEGVNLHQANTLVNYDSPWNSTRLMQRLGRINRIGSTFDKIYSYNFYPSTLGDSQINLYKRTLIKLQAFHNMFGEDSQIYTTDEELVEIKRPIQEESEMVDPNIEFITDLKTFKENEPQNYDRLFNLNGTAVTTVQTSVVKQDERCYTFVDDRLFELNNSSLTRIPTGLELCGILKSLSALPQADTEISVYRDYIKKSIDIYREQECNDSVSHKTRSGKRPTENSALGKLNSLQEKYKNTLTEDGKKKLQKIKSEIRGNNALARMIDEKDCTNLTLSAIERSIADWYDFVPGTQKRQENVKMVFVLKST